MTSSRPFLPPSRTATVLRLVLGLLLGIAAPLHAQPTDTAAGAGDTEAASGSPLTYSFDGDTLFQAEATRPGNGTTKGTVFNETNLNGHVNWSDWLSLNGSLKLEHQRFNNIDDFYPDRNSFFRSHGLSLRQLYVELRPFETDIGFYAGKIHPKFGSAWGDAEPGIFYNFGTDYEQEERIGGGFEWALPDSLAGIFGAARLSGEAFYLDTTFLSNSIFSRPSINDMFVDRPGQFHLADGGPSNTGGFNSTTIALQGTRAFAVRGLKYQISFTHEGVRDFGGQKPENGISIGVSYQHAIAGIEMVPFVELTHFNNAGGQGQLTRDYVILGWATKLGPDWEIDLAGGIRNSHDAVAGTRVLDSQANISLIYNVSEAVHAGIGYNHIRVDHVDSNTVGLQLTYDFTL